MRACPFWFYHSFVRKNIVWQWKSRWDRWCRAVCMIKTAVFAAETSTADFISYPAQILRVARGFRALRCRESCLSCCVMPRKCISWFFFSYLSPFFSEAWGLFKIFLQFSFLLGEEAKKKQVGENGSSTIRSPCPQTLVEECATSSTVPLYCSLWVCVGGAGEGGAWVGRADGGRERLKNEKRTREKS